jgi:hypothetical protein
MGDGTGRVSVELHFIVERNDSEHVPWDLIHDVSRCTESCDDDENQYTLENDIDSFTCGVWDLPIDPKDAEYGQKFEVKGKGCIEFYRCGEYGSDIDAFYDGTLTMELTNKEDCEA